MKRRPEKNRAIEFHKEVWYTSGMDNKTPVASPDAGQTPGERPPFNEVSVLFPLLSIYTAGYLGLMVADFFLKHSLSLLDGLMTIYIALLGAYAADKEIRRWMGTPEPPRKGSIFVYLWILFALSAFIIHSFCPEYVLPDNLITVCLQVLGIFFGSKASKYVCERRLGPDEADPGREKLVLDMITARGQVTRRMAAEELNVSRATAGRLLAGLETRGLIVRKGEGKGVYYVTASHSAP